MKQVLQSLRSGEIEVVDAPLPRIGAHQLLIQTSCTLLSAGTERMLLEFGRSGYLGKARQQPEKFKQALDKIRTDGLLATVEAIQTKLDLPLALGYCNVGTVIDKGSAVSGFALGDRVVSNGFHAENVRVPHTLAARIPDSVSDAEASFSVLGAIALESLRLASPELGESFAVVGLGMVGLLTTQLLRASGCRVLALDPRKDRRDMAARYGAQTAAISDVAEAAKLAADWTLGRGLDAVIIAAAATDDSPIRTAARLCRKRGRIVLVGTADIKLDRSDFYEKELSFQVSCSYGPGRYDPVYEQQGIDYPLPYVRWTAQRNFETALQLMSDRKLATQELVTSRFSIDRAVDAYNCLMEGKDLGILLEFKQGPEKPKKGFVASETKRLKQVSTRAGSEPRIAFIGPGDHANKSLIPVLRRQKSVTLDTVISSGGTGAAIAKRKFGFEKAESDSNQALKKDSAINTVFISTGATSHAPLALQALNGGKHCFVEKPLVTNKHELDSLGDVMMRADAPVLCVGFNRRFSPLSTKMKQLLAARPGAKTFLMTVNATWAPNAKASFDRGKRILTEGCHFVDFIRFLADSPIKSVRGIRALGPNGDPAGEDISIHLEFQSGSIGVINYLSSGHPSLPKERVEVFCGGGVLLLDNFRTLSGFGWSGFSSKKLWKQDKGHARCVEAFLRAVSTGEQSPTPWAEVHEVHATCLALVDQLGR